MSLPIGWEATTLGDCQAKIQSIDPRQFQNDDFDLFSVPSYTNYMPDRARGSVIGSTKQVVQPNDVLLCKIVPHIRRGWVVPSTGKRQQIASGEWIIFRGTPLEPEFLRRFILSDDFHEQFMRTVSGVGGSLMRARPADAAKISVPVPPAAEQRRIVAKLDALMGSIVRARSELDRVPVLAAILRRKALSEAIAGRLVEGVNNDSWGSSEYEKIAGRREAYVSARRGSRLRNDLGTDLRWLSGKQSGWLDCRLADIVNLRVGYAFKSADFSTEGGVPLLRGANVAPGAVDWTNQVCLPHQSAAKFPQYVLSKSDIVIAMDRPIISTGLKVAQIDDDSAGSLLVQRVANPRPTEWILPEYLLTILRSSLFTDQIEEHSTGSDLPHISANDILTTPVPLPPLRVQRVICDAVKAIFARADCLEAEAARARALFDRLESAILAKAFRGELVPQDPNDEPARILLDRIRAERAAAPKLKRGRRAATTV